MSIKQTISRAVYINDRMLSIGLLTGITGNQLKELKQSIFDIHEATPMPIETLLRIGTDACAVGAKTPEEILSLISKKIQRSFLPQILLP
jgi:hypothetical protein